MMTCRLSVLLFCAAIFVEPLGFAGKEPFDESLIFPTRGHLNRAFARMEASTAEKPETIRVLFYGQSIIGQKKWCEMIIDNWKRRYPSVNFVVKNLAIGGYGTDALARCMESDIFPFYPDVLFFHDYGDVTGGYAYILGEVRKRTTAEIAVWSSHLRFDEDPDRIMDLRAKRSVDRKRDGMSIMAVNRTAGIRQVAEDLDLVFVDLQGYWCRLLKSNGWGPKALIGDTVHMNTNGFPYYADILIKNLKPAPRRAAEGSASGTVKSVPFAKAVKRKSNGDLTFAFDGNRIAAVSDGTGNADARGEILIDGVAVKDIPSQWINTRSTPMIRWFPGCSTALKGDTCLQDEEWTLTVLSYVTNVRPKYVTYRVEGSKTGFDGEGCSTNLFVSKSGRIVLPGTWLDSSCNPWRCAGPKPNVSKTTWQSKLVPVSEYVPQPTHVETVLAQGLENGRHVLTIRGAKGKLGIGQLIVNRPNPKWECKSSEVVQKFLKKVYGSTFFYGDEAWH